jgi:hypothetical protein
MTKISRTGSRCNVEAASRGEIVRKLQKIVVDTPSLNLINFKAYEPIGFFEESA